MGTGFDSGHYSFLRSSAADRVRNWVLCNIGKQIRPTSDTANKAQSSRWTGVAVSDAVLEVLLFCLAAFVVYPLQMRVKRKAEVLASFAPRLM